MEAQDVRSLCCCHPGGLVFQPVQGCSHRGTEGRPVGLGGPVLQVVLDCPVAVELQCQGAEAKPCRLLDGAEPVSRQVPVEGWSGGMVGLVWRCLLLDVAESRDGRDSRFGLEYQGALAPRDEGQGARLFRFERRSVVSARESDDQAPSSVGVLDVPEPVSASDSWVWLPRLACWQFQV